MMLMLWFIFIDCVILTVKNQCFMKTRLSAASLVTFISGHFLSRDQKLTQKSFKKIPEAKPTCKDTTSHTCS